MNPLIVLAVVALAVVGYVVTLLWLWVRQVLLIRRLAAPINIVFLGYMSSGKTMLMLAMQRTLMFRRNGVRFIPEKGPHTPGAGDGDPSPMPGYSTAARPRATEQQPSSMREWKLQVMLQEEHRERVVLSFQTADFPGENLRSLQRDTETARQFLPEITTSHAVFGLLDGEDICMLLDLGEDDNARSHKGETVHTVRSRFNENFYNIVSVFLTCEGVCHLLITKWDFLTEHKYVLPDVIAFLREQEDFLPLTHHEKGLKVIPASAVGNQYFDFSVDQPWPKLPDARFRPVNVDVPFALACLQESRRRMTDSATAPTTREGSVVRRMSRWLLLRTSLSINLGIVALALQLDRPDSPHEAPQTTFNIEGGERLRGRKDAYQYLYLWARNRVQQLDHDYPESNLDRHHDR
ncbi:hypothetical protein JCM9957A_22420 [Kineosporia succinea]